MTDPDQEVPGTLDLPHAHLLESHSGGSIAAGDQTDHASVTVGESVHGEGEGKGIRGVAIGRGCPLSRVDHEPGASGDPVGGQAGACRPEPRVQVQARIAVSRRHFAPDRQWAVRAGSLKIELRLFVTGERCRWCAWRDRSVTRARSGRSPAPAGPRWCRSDLGKQRLHCFEVDSAHCQNA